MNDSLRGMSFVYADGEVDIDIPDIPDIPEVPDIDEEYAHYAPHLSDASNGERDAMRELARQQERLGRDYAKATRHYHRQMENLADSNSDESIAEQAQSSMQAARKAYEAGRQAYRANILRLKQQRQQAHDANVASLGVDAMDALCNYGTPLRSIGANEHITLIYANVVRDEDGRRDLIYVFSKKQLARCQDQKISPAQLLGEAQRYTF